jgi:hypothetical protein
LPWCTSFAVEIGLSPRSPAFLPIKQPRRASAWASASLSLWLRRGKWSAAYSPPSSNWVHWASRRSKWATLPNACGAIGRPRNTLPDGACRSAGAPRIPGIARYLMVRGDPGGTCVWVAFCRTMLLR